MLGHAWTTATSRKVSDDCVCSGLIRHRIGGSPQETPLSLLAGTSLSYEAAKHASQVVAARSFLGCLAISGASLCSGCSLSLLLSEEGHDVFASRVIDRLGDQTGLISRHIFLPDGPQLLLHVGMALLNLVLKISDVDLKESHLVVDLFVSGWVAGQLLRRV